MYICDLLHELKRNVVHKKITTLKTTLMFIFSYTLSIASKTSQRISSDDSVELSTVSSSREIDASNWDNRGLCKAVYS